MSNQTIPSNETCISSAISDSDGYGNLFKVIGLLITIYYLIKWTYQLIQVFRLYVYSQYYSETDYVKRYGKWAVISGATDGIGLAMACELAKRGHSIVVIGRNYVKLNAAREKLEGEKNVGDVVTIKIDLSDSSVENFEDIRSKLDPDNRDIGILINSAGVCPEEMKHFHRYDMRYLANMVNVNVIALVYITRMILPGMLERRRGLVMNISSVLSAGPSPYVCLYGPTKTLVSIFSRQLEIEYSSHPVDIVCVNPGPVITKMLRGTGMQLVKPGLIERFPDEYARSVINAISVRPSSLSGFPVHGILREGIRFTADYPVELYAFVAKYIFKRIGFNYKPSSDEQLKTAATASNKEQSKSKDSSA